MRFDISFHQINQNLFLALKNTQLEIAIWSLIGAMVLPGAAVYAEAAGRGARSTSESDSDARNQRDSKYTATTKEESQSSDTKESNIKNAGNKGSQFAGIGMMVNAGVGGMHVWQGKKALASQDKVEAAMHFGLAALNFAQMAADAATAGGAGQAADDASSGGWTDEGVSASQDSKRDKLMAKAAGAQRTLSQLGYRYDPNSKQVITPDGTFSPNDYSSPEAAKSAGMSPQAAEALKKILADEPSIQQKILDELKSSVGGSEEVQFGGGAGGGGNGGSYAAKRDSDRRDGSISRGGARSSLRSPGSLDGMKKFIGKDRIPVGLSVDNIFEMVRRKYQRRDQTRGFL